jgi:hypothetical protein
MAYYQSIYHLPPVLDRSEALMVSSSNFHPLLSCLRDCIILCFSKTRVLKLLSPAIGASPNSAEPRAPAVAVLSATPAAASSAAIRLPVGRRLPNGTKIHAAHALRRPVGRCAGGD